jgi:uncharacterized membrane protein YdjX (TVP38/TMEM64 family)
MDKGDTRDARRNRAWKRPAALGLILLALFGLVVWAYYRTLLFASLRLTLSDPGCLRALVVGWGPWGALALIGLQVAQIFLAPIPGQALGLVGGYLYGPWLGTLINMTGTLIGSGMAMWLARRFGRPLVQRWVPTGWLERLDGLAARRGSAFFFLIFLFPFLPDDAACFVAGLSPLPLGELLLLALLGRLPGVLIPNWLGAHATELDPRQWIAIVLLMIPVAVAFWRWQDSIESRLLRLLECLQPGRG